MVDRAGPRSAPDITVAVGAMLGVSTESLDPTGDLIMQGLDSLRMMRLAGQWRKQGLDVDFARLAADPTIAAWERLLGSGGGADSHTSNLPAAPTTGPFPLAPMQHAYWVGRSSSHAFGEVAAHLYIEFDGAGIDADRFRAAADALLARHPMLRVRVLPDGTQEFGAAHPEAVAVHDLRDHSEDEVAALLDDRRTAGTHRMLPISDGGVIRLELTMLPGNRARVHLDVDMIAADAMSYRVLVDDLARLYRGEQLAPLGVDFAALAAPRSERQVRASDAAWWRDRLDALPGAPELPLTEASRRGETSPATVRLHHAVSASEWKRLEDHAHRRGVTPAAAVAAAFAEAVGTHSATPRFLLTVPLFDREPVHPDVDRVVGDFTSSLLIDVDLTEDQTLADRARTMRAGMHEAAAHGSMNGLDVLRELSRRRGEPVVSPVVFTSALGLGELFSPIVTDVLGTPSWIVSQGPQVLLDAQVTEVAGGLLLNWDIRASDLEPGAARSMFAHYIRLLDLLIAGDWERPAPAAVTDEVCAQRLSTELPLPQSPVFEAPQATGTLHGSFFAAAADRAADPAVITDGRTWSHGELADASRRVAGTLTAAGVTPGATVVINLPKGAHAIIAALGVLAAGAAYVPIGPNQPAARRDRIMSVAAPAAILTDDPTRWSQSDIPALEIGSAATHDRAELIAGRAEDLAYVLFTSGSTGTPKGVEVPHRAAVATLTDLIDRYRLDDSDRTLLVSSTEFDLSVFDIFAMLAIGGAVVVPADDPSTRADDWARVLTEQSVTVLNCVPAILGMLLDLTALPKSLRTIILGGDKVEVSLAERVAAQLPDCRFAGLGGTTETAIHSTICPAEEVPPGAAFVPYGVPLRGVRCRVVDALGRDRPDLVTGELWIGGAGVADGYRADPQRTAERFVVRDGIRWYRTGDLARYLPGGFLEFLGRADHMVKVRGHRVELGEVESALLGVDGVTAAVVTTDGRDLLAAVAAERLDAGDIEGQIAETLPPHMLPRAIIVTRELPLTPNGKYDRARIAAMFDDADDHASVAPRGPVERALVRLLEQILPVRPIGVTDDFVGLGGDSVLATRFVARVREWLDTSRIGVADIFAHRTVEGLANHLHTTEGDRARLVAEHLLHILDLTDDQVSAEFTTPV